MGLISSLREKVPTKDTIEEENIVRIPFTRSRIACNNHLGPKQPGKERKKMKIGIVFSNANDLEYECECGITYVRDKNLKEGDFDD